MEDKEKFWRELEEVVKSFPKEERVLIGADFTGHVGAVYRGRGDGRDDVKGKDP